MYSDCSTATEVLALNAFCSDENFSSKWGLLKNPYRTSFHCLEDLKNFNSFSTFCARKLITSEMARVWLWLVQTNFNTHTKVLRIFYRVHRIQTENSVSVWIFEPLCRWLSSSKVSPAQNLFDCCGWRLSGQKYHVYWRRLLPSLLLLSLRGHQINSEFLLRTAPSVCAEFGCKTLHKLSPSTIWQQVPGLPHKLRTSTSSWQ